MLSLIIIELCYYVVVFITYVLFNVHRKKTSHSKQQQQQKKGLHNASLTALNLIFLNTSQSQKEMKKENERKLTFLFSYPFFCIYDLLFVVVLFVTKYHLTPFYSLPSLTNKKKETIERIFHFQTIFSIILT